MKSIKSCKAIIVGTGFSGLCMAIKLKEKGIHDFIILEKANGVGGTWRENTYPGAECDIPSALYSYSFEPYPYWEYKWSMQGQILEYIKFVTKKYELYDHIEFDRELTSAVWDQDKSQWLIKTKSDDHYYANYFIPAIGQLHHPSKAQINNENLFQGDSFHSAQWNHDIDLKGKRIGVIGNAASAVQLIPEIAKVAQEVTVFQRSANWMLAKQDRLYKSWEKALVKRFPLLLKLYRFRLWFLGEVLYVLLRKKNAWARRLGQAWSKWYIKKHFKDPEMIEKLTPKYPMGAKRILFSDTYYKALQRDNVHLEDGGIDGFYPGGLKTKNGKEVSCDIVVFATGFKTNPFLMNLDVKGQEGKSIHDYWKKGPKNYLGITCDGFPNLFMIYGPNTNLGHNSIILMSEIQTSYVAQIIEHLEASQYSKIEVKPNVLSQYYNETQKRLKDMIWTSIENSWYQSADGSIPNNYPGRTSEYRRRLSKPNFSDYILTP